MFFTQEFYAARKNENLSDIVKFLENSRFSYSSFDLDCIVNDENYNVIECLIQNGISQHHVCCSATRCGKINVLKRFIPPSKFRVSDSILDAIENEHYDLVNFLIKCEHVTIHELTLSHDPSLNGVVFLSTH